MLFCRQLLQESQTRTRWTLVLHFRSHCKMGILWSSQMPHPWWGSFVLFCFAFVCFQQFSSVAVKSQRLFLPSQVRQAFGSPTIKGVEIWHCSQARTKVNGNISSRTKGNWVRENTRPYTSLYWRMEWGRTHSHRSQWQWYFSSANVSLKCFFTDENHWM